MLKLPKDLCLCHTQKKVVSVSVSPFARCHEKVQFGKFCGKCAPRRNIHVRFLPHIFSWPRPHQNSASTPASILPLVWQQLLSSHSSFGANWAESSSANHIMFALKEIICRESPSWFQTLLPCHDNSMAFNILLSSLHFCHVCYPESN